jgi:hypothetical protein
MFRFCTVTEYARASTPLSCVSLWVLWHVCAYVRVSDTITLGWVAGAHPLFSYRNEMKEILGKLMTGEHTNLQYALLLSSFHSIPFHY